MTCTVVCGGSFGEVVCLKLQSGVLKKTQVLVASIFLVEQRFFFRFMERQGGGEEMFENINLSDEVVMW